MWWSGAYSFRVSWIGFHMEGRNKRALAGITANNRRKQKLITCTHFSTSLSLSPCPSLTLSPRHIFQILAITWNCNALESRGADPYNTEISYNPLPLNNMALSNNVIGAINFIAVLLSVPVIGAGVWLATEPDNSCVKILQWPVIILGILILVVALAGLIGGFWRVQWLLVLYLVVMLILIVLLSCLVVFVYMVTVRGHGHPEPSRVYLEYHLDDFSGWLKRRVRSSYKWDRIRTCLSSTSMCPELNQSYRMAQDFFNARISPLQVPKPYTLNSPCCSSFLYPSI